MMAQGIDGEIVQHDCRGAQRAKAKEEQGQTVLVRRAARVAPPVAQHERRQERERRAGDQVDPAADLDYGLVDISLGGEHQSGGERYRVQDRDRDRDPRPGRNALAGTGCSAPYPHHRIVARPGRLRHVTVWLGADGDAGTGTPAGLVGAGTTAGPDNEADTHHE